MADQATVHWGDGATQEIAATVSGGGWTITDAPHTYDDVGTYTVTVVGPNGGVGNTEAVVASDPNLILTVPANTAGTVDAPMTVTTRLQNTSEFEVERANQTIRLWVDTGTLDVDEVVYETQDGGTWRTKTFRRVDDKTIETFEVYPVDAHLDASSQIRVTVAKAATVKGRSTIREGTDVLTTADYQFTVTAVQEEAAPEPEPEPEPEP